MVRKAIFNVLKRNYSENKAKIKEKLCIYISALIGAIIFSIVTYQYTKPITYSQAEIEEYVEAANEATNIFEEKGLDTQNIEISIQTTQTSAGNYLIYNSTNKSIRYNQNDNLTQIIFTPLAFIAGGFLGIIVISLLQEIIDIFGKLIYEIIQNIRAKYKKFNDQVEQELKKMMQ